MEHTFELLAIGEKKPDLLSSLIQWGQGFKSGKKIEYSHLALLVDGAWVFDATERGTDLCTLDEVLDGGKAVIRRRIMLPVKSACCAIMWIRRARGIRYSWLQYAGFLFPFLRPLVKNGRRETVCCEIIADFLVDCCEVKDHRLAEPDWLMPFEVMEIADDHF